MDHFILCSSNNFNYKLLYVVEFTEGLWISEAVVPNCAVCSRTTKQMLVAFLLFKILYGKCTVDFPRLSSSLDSLPTTHLFSLFSLFFHCSHLLYSCSTGNFKPLLGYPETYKSTHWPWASWEYEKIKKSSLLRTCQELKFYAFLFNSSKRFCK